MSIFGTRPEAIKMAPVIQEMERHKGEIESVICVTAQHSTERCWILCWIHFILLQITI